MNKAIVVGSINMDIVAFVKEHPKTGETISGQEVRYFPGGKGSNQAVSCKRLGCDTLLVGCLGNDTFGKEMLTFLIQEGIDTTGIRSIDNAATGTAFITVAENATNSIIVISGANAIWDNTFIESLSVNAGDILLAQFEIPDEAIEQSFRKAKDEGAMTILNPAPVRPISREIQGLTDLIVINEHELTALTGTEIDIDNDEMVFATASHLAQDGYNAVIVTLGDRGIRLLSNDYKITIEARNVEAIDTTGAGDTFIGGLAAGLLSGLTLPEAAELANLAASISVTRPGAASSFPTRAEIAELLPKEDH